MCADYGIHRSYNDKGQPNLHIYILLTLRPLNEDGTWGAKSRKEYVLDADGNRIPNASGKGYKSRKVNVIDWNEKGKEKEWRNAIAEVINATNEKAGIAERVAPRSYKDREIPLIPTIHLGERVSALERKGIRTERGNINRAIEKYNAMIMKIYGFISELKEELKKGVFRFVLREKAGQKGMTFNLSINESKADKFVRLGEYRVNKVIDAIGRLENLSNRTNYEYTQEQVEAMFSIMEKRLLEVKGRFAPKKEKEDTFSFGRKAE